MNNQIKINRMRPCSEHQKRWTTVWNSSVLADGLRRDVDICWRRSKAQNDGRGKRDVTEIERAVQCLSVERAYFWTALQWADLSDLLRWSLLAGTSCLVFIQLQVGSRWVAPICGPLSTQKHTGPFFFDYPQGAWRKVERCNDKFGSNTTWRNQYCSVTSHMSHISADTAL